MSRVPSPSSKLGLATRLVAFVRRCVNLFLTLSQGGVDVVTRRRAFVVIRLIIEAYREFTKDNCFLRASALAYKTLLSLIPLLIIFVMIVSAVFSGREEQKAAIVNNLVVAFFGSEIAATTANEHKITPEEGFPPEATEPETETLPEKTADAKTLPPSTADKKEIKKPATRRVDISVGPEKIPDLTQTLAELRTNYGAIGGDSDADRRGAAQVMISDFIQQLFQLANTFNQHLVALGLLGVPLLFWTGISLLLEIEGNLNQIWRNTKKRSWLIEFCVFFTVLAVGPSLLALSVSLSAQIWSTSWMAGLKHWTLFGCWASFGEWFGFLISFFVFIAISTAMFTGIYVGMPNTRVRFTSALIGGLFSAICFETMKAGFAFYLKTAVTGQLAIYGSLAAVPIFIFWLWVLWVVFLLGAEIAYSHQNLKKIIFHQERSQKTHLPTLYLGTRIYTEICSRFIQGVTPPSVQHFSNTYQVDEEQIQEIMRRLEQSNLLLPIDDDKEGGYVPAQDLETITLEQVLRALQSESLEIPSMTRDTLRDLIEPIFLKLTQDQHLAIGSVSMKALGMQGLACLEKSARPPQLGNGTLT